LNAAALERMLDETEKWDGKTDPIRHFM
jgi:hypothetical protein